MMKIAILGTRGIPARYGGFETFAERLATRLVELGHSVTVFCESGSDTRPDIYQGVKLEYVASPQVGPLTTILFDLACLWRARRDFDIVYMLGYGTAFFCFLPRLWGSRVWINMDGIEWARAKWSLPARLYLRLMESIAMWTPNRIVADADAIRVHLERRHWHVPNCAVIPYGSDVVDSTPDCNLLEEWNLRPGKYYLVVCRFEPENHVLEIAEGFRASSTKLPLIMVGDHKSTRHYVQQLRFINDARVRLIGTVYDKEKLEALRFHCRAYFHGHSVGGTNPSLLEAMGCGNIVVAHDNPFNREVLQDLGLFFQTPEDVARIVSDIESGSVELASLRKKVIERIAQHYTWKQVTEAYSGMFVSGAIG